MLNLPMAATLIKDSASLCDLLTIATLTGDVATIKKLLKEHREQIETKACRKCLVFLLGKDHSGVAEVGRRALWNELTIDLRTDCLGTADGLACVFIPQTNDINEREDGGNGWTLLHHVCETGNIAAVAIILKRIATNPNALNYSNRTPLEECLVPIESTDVDDIKKRRTRWDQLFPLFQKRRRFDQGLTFTSACDSRIGAASPAALLSGFSHIIQFIVRCGSDNCPDLA